MTLKLAIVGDIHANWDAADAAYFARSRYDAVLFTGDLPRMRSHRNQYKLARLVSKVGKPAWMVPGNHDATTLTQILSELNGLPTPVSSRLQQARVGRLRRALGPVVLGGYSRHRLPEGAGHAPVDLSIARPHAMGGGLSFPYHLERAHGVRSLDESADRLCSLVDGSEAGRLVFLAHNGPVGLGEAPTDPFGCDFKREAIDWGDPDLRRAVDHALASGRKVLAVVAGHMHHRTLGRQLRTWHVFDGGVHYVNAARVPRWIKRDGRRMRHHVSLSIGADAVVVEERLTAP